MTFVQKFKSTDFLNVLDTVSPRSTAYVMDTLGCSRNTAKKFLDELEASSKVKKIKVEGANFGWVRVDYDSQQEETKCPDFKEMFGNEHTYEAIETMVLPAYPYDPERADEDFLDYVVSYCYTHPDNELARFTYDAVRNIYEDEYDEDDASITVDALRNYIRRRKTGKSL